MHILHKAQTRLLAVSIFALLFIPQLSHAASLYISPSSDAYSAGKIFSVRVRVSTTQPLNAISGNVDFPTDKLQVISVSKASSILTLWVTDPTFSNVNGSVHFEGVVPNPGYIGNDGLVVSITFKATSAGNAALNFDSASVLANDGYGTNILTQVSPATYSIGGVAPAPAPKPAASTPSGTPPAPTVTSSTHPDQMKWYQSGDAKFSWSNGTDVTATRVLLSKTQDTTPNVVYNPAIDSKEIDSIDDGIWYLSVQNKNSKGWGATAHYTLRIDSTAPESFTMSEIARDDKTDPRAKLALSASDNFSGIKSFGIQIDDRKMINWVDDGSGIYVTEPLTPGTHSIFARAYDQAGNFSTASVNVNIDSITSPSITSYTKNVTATSPLVVKGTADPNETIKVIVAKAGTLSNLFTASAQTAPYSQTTQSDSQGNWEVDFDTSNIDSGAFSLSAIAIDTRGAQSNPTAPATIYINSNWWKSIGSGILTFLAIIIPLIALIYLLLVITMRGMHHVRRARKSLRGDLRDVETTVNKAFELLKDDVEDSIRMLERTRSRRKLTQEEEAIIERFRDNIDDAEKVIHVKVKDLERRIDDR